MFVRAYGDARMPNWPHRYRTPFLRIASPGLLRNKKELFEAGNLSVPFLLCYWNARMVRLYSTFFFRILGLAGILAASGCFRVRPAWINFFLFCCCVANSKHRGMARSGIGCWASVAMGRLCRSCAISILRRIVKTTKAPTWSHPSTLFSIIGIKLSGVRGCSQPISCRVDIASSRYS